MSCRACQSKNQRKFKSEINIHFPGLKGMDKPTVWAFPELVVCLECGFTEFLIDKEKLHRLAEGSEEDVVA